jgi:hypothetical protein
MPTPQPVRSRFVNGGCPTRCANCHEPFTLVGNRVQAWRQGAFYFCSEFCADGFVEVVQGARCKSH